MNLFHPFLFTLNGLSSSWFPSPLSFGTCIKKACFFFPLRNYLFLSTPSLYWNATIFQNFKISPYRLQICSDTNFCSDTTSDVGVPQHRIYLAKLMPGLPSIYPEYAFNTIMHPQLSEVSDSTMESNLQTINGQVALL